MEFTITSSQILGICGLITALWGVYKIVKEIKQPSSEYREKVDNHTKLLHNDHTRLNELEKSDKMILQCLLVIINHDITGNGIENMKVTRDELQEFLINK